MNRYYYYYHYLIYIYLSYIQLYFDYIFVLNETWCITIICTCHHAWYKHTHLQKNWWEMCLQTVNLNLNKNCFIILYYNIYIYIYIYIKI